MDDATRPSERELSSNSRSRSAVLHVLRKVRRPRLADVEALAYPMLGWGADKPVGHSEATQGTFNAGSTQATDEVARGAKTKAERKAERKAAKATTKAVVLERAAVLPSPANAGGDSPRGKAGEEAKPKDDLQRPPKRRRA